MQLFYPDFVDGGLEGHCARSFKLHFLNDATGMVSIDLNNRSIRHIKLEYPEGLISIRVNKLRYRSFIEIEELPLYVRVRCYKKYIVVYTPIASLKIYLVNGGKPHKLNRARRIYVEEARHDFATDDYEADFGYYIEYRKAGNSWIMV